MIRRKLSNAGHRATKKEVKKRETSKDIKGKISYFEVMEKIYKIIIVLSAVVGLSFIFSFMSFRASSELSNEKISQLVATQIQTDISPKLESINNGINDINSALWLESEQHFLEVMNKVDNSVVMVLAFPATEKEGDLTAVFYVDANGNKGSLGTGFSINKKGYILTAKHVIDGATKVEIVLKDGTMKEVPSTSIASNLDLAILNIDSGVPPVDLMDSGVLDVGSKIGFIGFPLGSAVRTKTVGNISAVQVPIYVINSFINKGDSGGPVFSLKTGKVVGIINAVDIEKTGVGISTTINKDILPKEDLD